MATITSGRLTGRQAAAFVGVSHTTWYEWLKTGELEGITHTAPSGRRYWMTDELDAWLRSRCSPRPSSERRHPEAAA